MVSKGCKPGADRNTRSCGALRTIQTNHRCAITFGPLSAQLAFLYGGLIPGPRSYRKTESKTPSTGRTSPVYLTLLYFEMVRENVAGNTRHVRVPDQTKEAARAGKWINRNARGIKPGAEACRTEPARPAVSIRPETTDHSKKQSPLPQVAVRRALRLHEHEREEDAEELLESLGLAAGRSSQAR